MSSGEETMSSPYRNPAASSKSAPGGRIVTATDCFVHPARILISIGSSIASESGRTRKRPSSTTLTRVLVLLPRRDLPEVFSSISLSWSSLPPSVSAGRVSMHGPCTSDEHYEAHGPPECSPLPRGDRDHGRDQPPHRLQRPLRGADDERSPQVRRRGRRDGGVAAARAIAADRLQGKA